MNGMTKSFAVIAAVLIAASLAVSPAWADKVKGEGPVREEILEVEPFQTIKFCTIGELRIEQGETTSVRIEAQESFLPYIVTRVDDDALIIENKVGVKFGRGKTVRFFVTVKELEALQISGSGDAIVGDLKTNHLSLSLTASGDVELQSLQAGDLKASLTGSGDVAIQSAAAAAVEFYLGGSGDVVADDLATREVIFRQSGSGDIKIDGGEAHEVQVKITGSGDLRARKFDCTKAEVRITGSGSVSLGEVRSYLDVKITGSGDVRYRGEPEIQQKVTGSGDLRHR